MAEDIWMTDRKSDMLEIRVSNGGLLKSRSEGASSEHRCDAIRDFREPTEVSAEIYIFASARDQNI